jgi:predicted dehydrogenase
MPILTTVVGDGLAAHRAWASLQRCELFEIYEGHGPFDVRGVGEAAAGSWTELLERPEIELLVLAVPHADRLTLSRAARAAGKAVLLEEGPPLSLRELDQLAEDDANYAVPMGMVLPLRGLLIPDHGITGLTWTSTACGGLIISHFTPASGPLCHAAHNPAQGPLERWPSQAVIGAVTPYLDLVCQLFGKPVSAHIDGAEKGSAVGSVEFDSGARLSLVVTVRSAIEEAQLKIMDADRTVTLQGRELRVEDAGGLVLHRVPPLSDLRLSSYREMAFAVHSVTTVSGHSPTSARALADCLALLHG